MTLSGLLTRNANFGRCFGQRGTAYSCLMECVLGWYVDCLRTEFLSEEQDRDLTSWLPSTMSDQRGLLKRRKGFRTMVYAENSDDPRVLTLHCQTARTERPFITPRNKRAQSSNKVANPPDAGASSANTPRVLAQRVRRYVPCPNHLRKIVVSMSKEVGKLSSI